MDSQQPSGTRSSDSELEQLFDLSLDLCCIGGFDGYFRRVNPAFERTFGYSKQELMSRPFLDFVHPDDVQSVRDVLGVLVTGQDVAVFVDRMICADGSVRWIAWNTRGVPEEGVAYGVGRDFTERRRTDAELREAKRIAETSRDELRLRVEEQAALRRVATLVAGESSPDEVFAKVAEEVGLLLDADAAAVWRYEPDGDAAVAGSWGDLGGAVPVGRAVAPYARNVGLRCAVGTPIVVGGRLWGSVEAESRGQPMAANAESRIAEFAALVATAISNVQARSDLAASRARIAATADRERRRVVRDLHDGAQQCLVYTIVTLKLARDALERDREDAAALMTDALRHAVTATEELRELAHGILPSALTHGGLRAGIRALASRMSIPVEVDIAVERLPHAVEATAYFIVAEALTNVAKHAQAHRATVAARLERRILQVEVRDDGVGGARPDGNGLLGIRDRLAALDGRLRIESPPDRGTLIAAAIPLPDEGAGART